MNNILNMFNKVGGIKLLDQYRRSHVLVYAVIIVILCGFSKKSLEIARLAINNKMMKKMRKKFKIDIKKCKDEYSKKQYSCSKSDIIWFCWFQGLENAPQLVKKCYESLLKIKNKQIVLITEDNYMDYVSFPSFILEKYSSGSISKTHLSDLIRLELLICYGGTWIDSTVYCSSEEIPDYMLNSDLFLFQNLKPGLDGQCTRISNWFMTASSHNKILELTRDLLYIYWRNNNRLTDYFIFHKFFELAIEEYPEEWKKVYPSSNAAPHILLLRLFDDYDECIWKELGDSVPFHKLTYKFNKEQCSKQSYYSHIICNS